MRRTLLNFRSVLSAAMGVVLWQATAAPAAIIYTGMLTGADPHTSGDFAGSGAWLDRSLEQPSKQADWTPAQLSWHLSQNPDHSWHYEYDFTVSRGGVSHFILQVSDNFTAEDIYNVTGDFGSILIGTFSGEQGHANPNMPAAMYGIKFDATTGTSIHISFDSTRVPVWGDFYAKNGRTGGIDNTLWNRGFTMADTDPLAPVTSGSLDYHIPVPDSVHSPEPGSMLLMTLGALGLGCRKRR